MEHMTQKLNINKLKGILVEKKLSHQDVADLLGVCRVTVTNMLNGKAKITAEDLFKICKLINKDMSIFFEESCK